MTPRGLSLLVALLVVGACGGAATDDDAGPATTAGEATSATASDDARASEGARCSAAQRDGEVAEQAGLPEPVADTRRRIAEAAEACDFRALAAIAEEGEEEFTYSFGDRGDAAGFWKAQEAAGGEPMRFMVELLERPYRAVEDQRPAYYAWPSAFTYDSWDEVPRADREALKPLYDEDEFARFERFGGYSGYRVVISGEGEWMAFVAGD